MITKPQVAPRTPRESPLPERAGFSFGPKIWDLGNKTHKAPNFKEWASLFSTNKTGNQRQEHSTGLAFPEPQCPPPPRPASRREAPGSGTQTISQKSPLRAPQMRRIFVTLLTICINAYHTPKYFVKIVILGIVIFRRMLYNGCMQNTCAYSCKE